jgi:UDP-N-acetylglucosamine--N-acetylmuramyl-(pentapeptide) pyrophosphoryl-undecaprenol N-acetylglucosamine transferase
VKTVLFAGGGTGGHLMPALAIAEAMVKEDPSVRPFFVGAMRGVEATVLPARPWPYVLLPLEPIYRRQWWRNIGLPLRLWRSIRMARHILAREAPVLAVGTGGYVAGPVLLSAARGGVPTVLQEQNAFPGFATRQLASRARQIHLGFPEAAQHLHPGPDTVVRFSGNPIQPPPAVRPDRAAAKARLGFRDAPLLLVVGGSQGALAINRVVGEALAGDRLTGGGLQVLWQTGAGTHDQFVSFRRDGTVRVESFLDPIADAYAAADLVVARAGAMTMAELAAWGLPAILVPLPTAAADHQLANARAAAESGAAVLIEQRDLTPDSLAGSVRSLLGDSARLARLRESILGRGRPQAASDIAREALGLIA